MLKGKCWSWLLTLLIVVLSFVAAGCSAKVAAPDTSKPQFPTKPVTLIVPFSAGGGTDVGTRIVAKYAEKHLGQPFVVVNVPGGGSEVGVVQMLNSAPDGYTIGGYNSASIMLTTMREAKYHPIDDVKPICLVVSDPRLFAVRANDDRFKSFDDFISYAQANPGKLTIGTSGAGTSGHFSILVLNKAAGIETKPVHFGGAGESKAAFLGGHVDAVAQTVGEVMQMVKEGQARVIAVASEQRLKEFPDVPTFKEKGIDLVIASNRGFAAPKDTPDEAVKIIADSFKKATEDPALLEEMANMGLPVKYLGPQEFRELIKQEYQLYQEVGAQLK